MKGDAVRDAKSRREPLFVRRGANFDDAARECSFIGGMRYGYTGVANWTHPLVTLDMCESGLELRSTFSFLRFMVPVWQARYDEISAVHWLGRPIPDSANSKGIVMVRGVRFTTIDRDWVIFWCYERNHILDALAERGLKIEPVRKRFSHFSPDA